MIRVENWNGYDIRFVEQDGEWWAILKDICDALGLIIEHVVNQLDTDMMIRVRVEACNNTTSDIRNAEEDKMSVCRSIKDCDSKGVKVSWMIAINELGIYEALYLSRRLEPRKFRRWSRTVMQKLRRSVGLEGYEVMRMTDKDIQDDIDHILDTLFWDEETGKLMQSVTVQGGDVEQIPFEP